MKFRHWLLALTLSIGSQANAADSGTVAGTVTNINTERQTITIRTDDTLQRRTYFVGEDSQISSKGRQISLGQIKRGQSVNLRYRDTDRGREIISFRLPEPDEIVDIIPIEITEEQSISGTVTGVRSSLRTITIRDDATRKRRTLNVPLETRITRAGNEIALNRIRRGDEISARYRITEQGLILVTGRSPKPAATAAAPMAELPKTAGHLFAYLLAALGLFAGAGLTRVIRQRSAR